MSILFSKTAPELAELLANFRHVVSDSTEIGTIIEINQIDFDGTVHNFEVPRDHSYVVGGMCVANCEDCDFYARLAGGSNWLEDRVFDFLHLWHSRVTGWEAHHALNRNIESKLKQRSISERIELQHRQLMKLGYSELVEQYAG